MPRKLVFVCVGLESIGKIVSHEVVARTSQEAFQQFLSLTGINADAIHGPYRPRKQITSPDKPKETTFRFSDQVKKASYNGWEVNACLLQEPIDHAFLIFIKRIDGKKQAAPKGSVVVPLTDLRTL